MSGLLVFIATEIVGDVDLSSSVSAMCFPIFRNRRTDGFDRCPSFITQTIVLAENLSDLTA
ncbi:MULTISPECIES: hypothetical protein [unclassified Pseudomonas]|uniref:hypothetical protein n=1 Tax=unclassified Pseudomonas TaxID=196821 RepID=UPI00155259E3|nr:MULTISPECIES: hypothetical protein [unclassified Pseudomonas]